MVVPIHFKRRRLTLALCLGLVPNLSWAGAADWECAQGKNGKDWVCATRKAPPKADSGPVAAPPSATGSRNQPSTPIAAEPEAPVSPPARREPPPPSVRAEPPAVAAEPEAPASPPVRREPAALPVRAEPPAVAAEPETPASPPVRREPPPPSVQAEPPAPAKPALTAAAPRGAAPSGPIRATLQPSAMVARSAADQPRPGWNCKTGEGEGDDRGWNCQLTGPDPGGTAHPVDARTGQPENWTESNTFTPEDEQRIGQLASLLPADPWKNMCVLGGRRQYAPIPEFILTPADKLARDKAPLDIHSNYFEMVDNEIANFSGAVDMTQADQKLWADFVSRDTVTNTFNAHGRVVFEQKGLALASDTGFMDLDTSRGVFRNSQFILATAPGRGSSRLTYLDSDTLSRYEKVTYTTCPAGNQDWLLHASTMRINKETGNGRMKNAWLEFHGVPLFYTPYMSFPIDNRRKSGFLGPSIGTSTVSGFSFMAPYYFNLAPNYDYTATPRYMVNRGMQLRNEFRYLTPMTRGRIIADIVPHDELTNTTRGQAGFLNDTRFSDRLVSHLDANYVSDNLYTNQLGNLLNLSDWRFIRSNGTASYRGDSYSVTSLVDYYQTIDPTIPSTAHPYFHLPQLQFRYGHEIADTGLQFDGQTQWDSFANDGTDRTTGQRLKIKPRLYYPFQSAAGYITPSVSLLHNEYWLQDPQYWAQSNNAPAKASQSLTVPIASIDSGLYFERDFQFADTPLLHTLEPRLFYVYIPERNQASIPVFDSSLYDYTFYQLFRENRFTGSDRVGDANQVSVALTSRLIDQSTGLERLRGSVGNAFYFNDRQVTLSGSPTSDMLVGNSNIIGDVYAGITEDWSVRGGGQWNDSLHRVDRAIVSLQYNNRQNQLFNAAYRFRRNQSNLDCLNTDPNIGCLDLTDVSFRLPVYEGWHAIGRWQYSLMTQTTLESFFGFERETCCWRFTLLARHYINGVDPDTKQNVANNGVFLQFELKGLTRIGDEVDSFMERSVSGYRFSPNH